MNRTRSDSRYLELESSSTHCNGHGGSGRFSVCVETNTSRPDCLSLSLSSSHPSPFFLPCNRCSYFTVHLLRSPLLLRFRLCAVQRYKFEIIISPERSKSTPRSRLIARIFLGNWPLPVFVARFHGSNEDISYGGNGSTTWRSCWSWETPPPPA